MVLPTVANALDPGLSISQYSHTRWITRETTPPIGQITAITQSEDGYLWVAGGHRLYRFDGVHFHKFEDSDAPKNRESILALFGGQKNKVWVGSVNGLSVIEGVRRTRVSFAEDMTPQAVVKILEDRGGTVWAVAIQHSKHVVIRVSGGGAKVFGAKQGVPQPIRSIQVERDGRVSAHGDASFCVWDASSAATCGAINGPGAIQAPPWLARMGSRSTAPFALPRNARATLLAGRQVLQDRDGNLWMASMGQGIARMARNSLETFRHRDGLSGDLVEVLFEDRDGNIWTGTSGGLDRFRSTGVVRYTTIEGMSGDVVTSVVATKAGAVWAGTVGGGLNRVDGQGVRSYGLESGLPSLNIFSVLEDSRGALWAAGTGGLSVLNGSRFSPMFPELNRLFAMAETAKSIWLVDGNRRLYRLEAPYSAPREVALPPSRQDVYRIAPSRTAGIWMGFYKGGMGKMTEQGQFLPVVCEGFAKGPVIAIHEAFDGDVWIGTPSGLTRFRNGACTTWDSGKGVPEGGIQAIAEDEQQGLFLLTPGSIRLLERKRMAALRQEDALEFSPRNLLEDGQLADIDARSGGPRMSRSTNGNLWIATDSGLAMAHSPLVRSAPPPAVTIQSIIANRRAIPAESTKTLVAEGEQVEFQYTAVELTSPERLVFRHRLEGFRAEWTPAEPRRAATFTNLRPGNHRFCVAASLNGIDWGDPACQVIYAPPKFYQTWLFYLTASALGCAVFGGTYYLRVRSIQERFRAILEERMRVARELHDTLLQGFAGISYQLEVACRQMETAPQASRERIERAMDHADHSIAQARRAISLLRLSQLELGISAAVMAAGTQLTSDTGIRFSMNNARLPGTLPHHVEGTLYLIACEAIQNAVKHATPRLIEVSITQATTAGITLRIADDGKGFVVKEGMAKTGHWGLQGMAERARSIEAQFKIDSAPGQGTVVQVQVQSAPLLKKLWTPRWFRDAK